MMWYTWIFTDVKGTQKMHFCKACIIVIKYLFCHKNGVIEIKLLLKKCYRHNECVDTMLAALILAVITNNFQFNLILLQIEVNWINASW